jgi:hypothetical protein
VERGQAHAVTLRTIDRIAEAVGARTSVRILWQGESLDRLLDAAHAELVEAVVALLRRRGWEVVTEATFSIYGERGSVDILAYHPKAGALLVIEVKSAIADSQGLLAGIDRNVRLAPQLARDRGWLVKGVSRLLVVPANRTIRRRLTRLTATFDLALPLRTVAVRRWLVDPRGVIAGILFVPSSQRTTARHRVARGRAFR